MHKPVNKINVAHVSGSAAVGGSQVHTRMLIEGLPSEKYNHFLVLPEPGVFSDWIRKERYPCLCVPMNRKYHPGSILKIRRWFKDNQIDIVHTHLRNADLHGLMGAFLAGVPVRISTLHDIPNSSGTRVENNFSSRIYLQLLSRLSSRVIAISQFISSRTLEQLPTLADRISVIYNASHLVAAPGRAEGSDTRSQRIGWVGRLTPRKRPTFFVRVMTRLIRETPGFSGHIFGDGPLNGDIQDEIQKNGMEEKIYLHGVLPPEEIYRGMDVLFFSAVDEPFGRVITEAMGFGVPVLAARSGAVPEIITGGENGLLFNPHDEEDSLTNLRRLLDDTSLRENIIRGGFDSIRDQFSVDTFVRETSRVYQNALYH